MELAAAVAAVLATEARGSDPASPWHSSGWLPVGLRKRDFGFRDPSGRERRAMLRYGGAGMTLVIDGHEAAFSFAHNGDGVFEVLLDGAKARVIAILENRDLYLRAGGRRFELAWLDPFAAETDDVAGADRIVAPLPGTVVALLVKVGDAVEKGAAVMTLEVMKMEQTLRAPFAGTVRKVACRVGDIVQEGVELAEIEPAS